MRRQMRGEVVFITGGSRGLGLALARECADRGARLAICARDEDELHAAASGLHALGADVLPLVCDVRDREQIQRAVRRAQAAYGRLDMLINDAGTITVGPLETLTLRDYKDAMDTHFWAMLYAVEAARPLFEHQRHGRIVNISSIGGKIAVPHLLAYSASKFAAAGYSQGLHAELRRKNISVTTVFPGLMRTGSPRNAFFKSQNEKEYAWFMLSDALPGLSISAGAASRAIVDAALAGRAEIVLSLPAKAAAFLHALAPGLTANLLSVAARVLPAPGGIGAQAERGSRSETPFTRLPVTALTRKAERDLNQL